MTSIGSSDYLYFSTIEVYHVRVNWRELIDDMQQRAMSYNAQARALGVPWTSFEKYIYHNSRPRWEIGNSILILHSKVCGIDLTRKRLSVGDT